MDCAFKGSFFLDIKLPHSFVPPLRVTLLIQLLITSVLSIFSVLLPITILQSYYEEKDSIEIMGTFQRLTIAKYRALREKGAPKAIPTVCASYQKGRKSHASLCKITHRCPWQPRRSLLVKISMLCTSSSGTLSVWLLMGVVEWFSGTHFSWSITPSVVKVHMNQAGFAANLAEHFQVDNNPNVSKLITIPPLLRTRLAFLLMRPQTPPMTRTRLPNNDNDIRRHL